MVLEDDRVMTYGMLGLTPKLLFKINGNLDLELDEDDLKTLLETPMAQVANVNANQLVSSLSSVGEFSHLAYFNEELNHEDEEYEDVEKIMKDLSEKEAIMGWHPKWQ